MVKGEGENPRLEKIGLEVPIKIRRNSLFLPVVTVRLPYFLHMPMGGTARVDRGVATRLKRPDLGVASRLEFARRTALVAFALWQVVRGAGQGVALVECQLHGEAGHLRGNAHGRCARYGRGVRFEGVGRAAQQIVDGALGDPCGRAGKLRPLEERQRTDKGMLITMGPHHIEHFLASTRTTKRGRCGCRSRTCHSRETRSFQRGHRRRR